jgi:hypothetical protein
MKNRKRPGRDGMFFCKTALGGNDVLGLGRTGTRWLDINALYRTYLSR